MGIPASKIDWNKKCANTFKIEQRVNLYHSNMTASSSSSSAKNQSHAAASDHPRQSAEVRVNIRLDVVITQPRVMFRQLPMRSWRVHPVGNLYVVMSKYPRTDLQPFRCLSRNSVTNISMIFEHRSLNQQITLCFPCDTTPTL